MVNPTYNTAVYFDQNGNELVIGSGGMLTVQAGGAINIQAGGSLTGEGGTSDPNLAIGTIGVSFPATQVGTSSSVRAVGAGTINKVIMDSFDSSGNAVSGSAVIGVKKNGTSIVASDAPTLSNQSTSADTTLTGWTLGYADGDLFTFTLNSVAMSSSVVCTLKTTKS